MPFTDVFGGSTVQPSDLSYRAVALSANTTFSWPESFDTDNTVARVMDITPSGAGLTITMPDATETTPGRDTLIRNLGADTITVVKNDSTALTTVAAGEAKYIYLTSNSTAAGTWSNVTFGTGTSSVDAATLVGYGIMASGSTLNQTHDVTEASNDFTVGETDRARLYSCTAGLTVTLPAAVSTSAGFFFMLRNNGTGTVTVAKTGGDTIDAATSIALAPAESCFVCRLSSSWVTVGRGRSTEFVVTQLTKSVAGGADVTLSSTEAANRILKFTGLITANINVIVPSVVGEYILNNATTGSFTLTVKTAAGIGFSLSQNNQYVAYCDGVNVYNLPSSLPAGSVTFTDGSASAPSITFSSDFNTGFFRPGSDQLGATVGGVSVLTINSTGINAELGATTPAKASVTTIELGHASDTTLARSAAGVMTIEGVEVVTLSRAQTLTNKTLTDPAFSGATTNMGSVTTIDINGGTIDGTVIGGSTPAAVTCTSLTSSLGLLTGSGSGLSMGWLIGNAGNGESGIWTTAATPVANEYSLGATSTKTYVNASSEVITCIGGKATPIITASATGAAVTGTLSASGNTELMTASGKAAFTQNNNRGAMTLWTNAAAQGFIVYNSGNWKIGSLEALSVDTLVGGSVISTHSSTGLAITGTLSTTGAITLPNNLASGITTSNGYINIKPGVGAANHLYLDAPAGASVYLRPNGSVQTLEINGTEVINSKGYYSSTINAALDAPTGFVSFLSVNKTARVTASATGASVTGDFSTTGNVTLGDASTDAHTINGYASVGGTAPNAGVALRVALGSGNSGTTQIGLETVAQGTSGATSRITCYQATGGTAAASYTVANLIGCYVTDALQGAGSTITNQYGFLALDQTKGANNYGIASQVSSGANKWNIYASGTANNAFAGNVRIGSTTAPTVALDVTGAMAVSGNVTLGDATTDTVTVNGYMAVGGAPSSAHGIRVRSSALDTTVQSGVYSSVTGSAAGTSVLMGFYAVPATAASAYTAANVVGFYADTVSKGAGSTITNAHGVYIADQAVGTNNYGITSLVSSGSNKWNIYASGTASNYFNGLIDLNAGQIKFPATQVASTDANTLDDYREATFTATATGMTTAPTGTATFVRAGNKITLDIPTISGTSNAVTFTLTGMPTTCRPSATRTVPVRVQDNGGAIAWGMAQIDSAGVITLYKDAASGAFTGSGTKSINTCSVAYVI